MKSSLLKRLILGAVVASALFLAISWLPVKEWTGELLLWIQTLGPAAPVILIAVYILASVLLISGSLITPDRETIRPGRTFG